MTENFEMFRSISGHGDLSGILFLKPKLDIPPSGILVHSNGRATWRHWYINTISNECWNYYHQTILNIIADLVLN